MPEVELENFGVGGILRDKKAYTIPPEFWTAGKNVRFVNGEAHKILGEQEIYPSWGYDITSEGTLETVVTVTITDNEATFQTDGLTGGETIYNITDGTNTTIASVSSETTLVVTSAIFAVDDYYIVGSTTSYTVPLWLMPWRDATATGYWLAPTAEKILRYSPASITDVTRTASDYNGDADTLWSGGVLGGIPILNNDAGDVPQGWNGTSDFVDLPNWTAGDTCNIMRIFKQFAVAYDVSRSSTRHPHMVKWSSPAFPGSVPDFWDNANSNDSNETNLSEGGGFIIDAEPLGDINMIYKEEATYGMQHVGGEFVFRFFPMPFKSGMLAPRCAKTVKGQAFVVTKDDVITHNGQEAVSVIDGVNRNYLFNNMSSAKYRKTFVTPNYAYNEIWICFVSNGVDGDYADEALIWNYKDNTWGHKTLLDVPHIGYGLLDKSAQSSIIDDQGQVIDTDTSIIDGNTHSSGRIRLLGIQADTLTSRMLEFDTGTTNSGTTMPAYVERTGITIVGKDRQGQPKVSNFTTKMVQRVYPKIASTGSVDVYIGYQARLEGSITYSGPHAFDPAVDNHIDIRLQGKAICLKIGSSADIEWSVSGATFEMEVLGGSVR